MDPGGSERVSAGEHDGSRERRTRRLATLSFIALIAAGVALYAWIQVSSPSAAPASAQPLFPTLAPPGGGGPGSGEIAPLFTVPTLDGGSFSLEDHLANDGRPVFLNLWASWCLPCRQEMPALEAAAARHPGVRFVGVAVRDRVDSAAAFAAEVGVTYTLGVDVDGIVDQEYPILGMPATFIISPEGVVLKRVYGQLLESQIDADLATFFGG